MKPDSPSSRDRQPIREESFSSNVSASSNYALHMERVLEKADKRKGQSSSAYRSPSLTSWRQTPSPAATPLRGLGEEEHSDWKRSAGRHVVPEVYYSPGPTGLAAWKKSAARNMKNVGDHVGGVLDGLGFGAIGKSLGNFLSNCCCLCPQPRTEPESFCSNEVITSKYSLLTFLPLNLFEQFQRVANFYFLVVVVLMYVPGLAVVSGTTTIIPLVFVLTINAIKEAHDDVRRHRNDILVNTTMTKQVVNDRNDPVEIPWRNVQVGHILKVDMNESIPADMVLLQSSDPDNLCYVETANLDGETNLKLKYCYPGTSNLEKTELMSRLKELYIECEHPNASLYTYDGAVVYSGGMKEPLTADNLLLRGCTLRNAQWVIGLVVFTGPETKIMLNAVPAPRKVSRLERNMNHMVVCMFLFQLLISALCALGTVSWSKLHPASNEWYIAGGEDWDESTVGSFFLYWMRYALLLNQMIPISLYVTLELVKFAQCMLLYNNDLGMYHEETDTPFNSRTTTLNEELGQVKYVLSDKTGTLTQNVMAFVMASVGGSLYGNDTPEEPPAPAFLSFLPHTIAWDMQLRSRLGETQFGETPRSMTEHHFNSRQERERQRALQDLDDFMLGMALCNSVVPTTDASDELLFYQATSPDEEALVQGAAYLGYTLLARTKTQVKLCVKAPNSPRYLKANQFEVLATLEFDSDRKRMSIIVRELAGDDPAAGQSKIRLYCKGADSIIAGRLVDKASVRGGKGSELQAETQRHLDIMAQQGYRTLSFAHKDLTERQFQDWYGRYQQAAVSPVDRDKKIAQISDEIEHDLILDGATGVEDKLQDYVPQAIETLGRAGIKVWVLTGDKVETAISIAHTCRLFNTDMHLEKIRDKDLSQDPEKFLKSRAQQVRSISAQGRRVGLVIDGTALNIALKPECEAAFLALCLQMHSVVCCRVSPMQKADITRLVSDRAGAVTLGIGDGANDVSMIKAAHVGCGISGREGRAAVLASDYAFAQFHYLVRLLLVHGRAAYKRNSLTVLYSFYKNFMYCLPFAFATTITGFSAMAIYPEAMLTTFNAVWTALPIIAYAVFEQDKSIEDIMRHPEVYKETMDEGTMKFGARLFGWVGTGTWHALVAFLLPLFSMAKYSMVDAYGHHYDWPELGLTVFTAVFLVATFKVALKTRHWTAFNIGATAITLALWFPFLFMLAGLATRVMSPFFTELVRVEEVLSGPHYWLAGVILAPILALLPDWTLSVCHKRLTRPLRQTYSWSGDSAFARGPLRKLYGPLMHGTGRTKGSGRSSRPSWSPTATASSSQLGAEIGKAPSSLLALSFPIAQLMHTPSMPTFFPPEERESTKLLPDTPTSPARPQGSGGWSKAQAVIPAMRLRRSLRHTPSHRTTGLIIDRDLLDRDGPKRQLVERSAGSAILTRTHSSISNREPPESELALV